MTVGERQEVLMRTATNVVLCDVDGLIGEDALFAYATCRGVSAAS